MTTSASPDQKKGLLLTATGALFLTFDTPLLRLIDGNVWPVLFWRMVLLSIALLAWWFFMKLARRPMPLLVNGKTGLTVSLLYAAGNVTFILSVFNTNIANVVFILAMTPVIAAVFSFIIMREAIGAATLATLMVAMGGVGIIVWDGIGTGTLFGNLLAASSAVTLALAFTLTRKSGRDMSMAPILAGVITAAVALAAATGSATGLSIDPQKWLWMGLNGLVVMPVSYALMALGPRYISASEVALFLLLETVLAPIWVWLAVGEKATPATLAGGAVILTTLACHSVYKLRRSRNMHRPRA